MTHARSDQDEAHAFELVEAAVVVEERAVVDHVSLVAAPGSATALVGHVGGGKTTLLRLLAGLAAPTAGSVRVFGEDLATLSYDGMRAHRRRVGFVHEGTGLLGNLTLGDNVGLPLLYHDAARLGRADIERRVRAIADELGLSEALASLPHRTNASFRKRALFARALVLEPKVLLCDEPQVGLTKKEARRVADAIERRRAARGMAVVYADHDGYFDPFVADRVLYVEHGRLLTRPSMQPPADLRPDDDGERLSLTTAAIYRQIS